MTIELEIKATRLFQHYLDALDRYLNKMGNDSPAQEKFRRRIEECIDIHEQGADDFRRSIVAFFWHLEYNGKNVTWDCNPELAKAICTFLDANPDELIPAFEYSFGKKHRSIDDAWESQIE